MRPEVTSLTRGARPRAVEIANVCSRNFSNFFRNFEPPFPEKKVRNGTAMRIAISTSDRNSGRPNHLTTNVWIATGVFEAMPSAREKQ